MHRVVDPSILLTGQAGIRQGLFLYNYIQVAGIFKFFG